MTEVARQFKAPLRWVKWWAEERHLTFSTKPKKTVKPQRLPSIPPEREQEFRDMIAAGRSASAIGKVFGVHNRNPQRWAKERGLTLVLGEFSPKQVQRLPKHLHKAFREAVANSKETGVEVIRQQFNIKGNAFRRWARELGIEDQLPPKGERVIERRADAKKQKLVTLWPTSLSREEIAAQLGVKIPRLQQMRAELNLPDRPQDYGDGTGAGRAWSKEEDDLLRAEAKRRSSPELIALRLPGRSATSVQARILGLGLKYGGRGRRPADLLALKVKECLEKRGPTPTSLLYDYTKVRRRGDLVSVLTKLRRNGEIVRTGGNSVTGLWDLAR